MGYVHDTDICQFIPPSMIQKSAGTWTPTISTNLISDVRAAEDTTFTLIIPLTLPGSEVGLQGAQIVSIDVWWKNETGNMDSIDDPVVTKQTLSADTEAVSGAALVSTIDAAHATNDLRKTMADHKMTVTLTTPTFVKKNAAYIMMIACNAAVGSVFTLFGAQVNYVLRL